MNLYVDTYIRCRIVWRCSIISVNVWRLNRLVCEKSFPSCLLLKQRMEKNKKIKVWIKWNRQAELQQTIIYFPDRWVPYGVCACCYCCYLTLPFRGKSINKKSNIAVSFIFRKQRECMIIMLKRIIGSRRRSYWCFTSVNNRHSCDVHRPLQLKIQIIT